MLYITLALLIIKTQNYMINASAGAAAAQATCMASKVDPDEILFWGIRLFATDRGT